MQIELVRGMTSGNAKVSFDQVPGTTEEETQNLKLNDILQVIVAVHPGVNTNTNSTRVL